jgi:polyhydroxybutyrate depolymerase
MIPRSPTVNTFRYDDEVRSYLLTLPPHYDKRTPYPLIFNFHGNKSSKELQEVRTSMGVEGAARGYIVVTPDALGDPRRWNTPGAAGAADDFGFIPALMDNLRLRLCIDPGRIYATGHSNGSEFAAALVCHPPFQFAAVGMVSSTYPARCPDGIAPAVIAIHGTADAAVPYKGGTVGGGTTRVRPAEDVIKEYADRYDCGLPTSDEVRAGVIRIRYSGCIGGAEVVLLAVPGGTHPWPSSLDAKNDRANSVAGRTFAATSAILDFFSAHRAPARPGEPSRPHS